MRQNPRVVIKLKMWVLAAFLGRRLFLAKPTSIVRAVALPVKENFGTIDDNYRNGRIPFRSFNATFR
jgi:hypothetical protein